MKKRKLKERSDSEAREDAMDSNGEEGGPRVEEFEEKKEVLKDSNDVEREQEELEKPNVPSIVGTQKATVDKKKERLLKQKAAAEKRGICYLSRIPPQMGPDTLRHILSQYGEIERIYLVPEETSAQLPRNRAKRFKNQKFSEGWVEFASRSVAKRVAYMLNGEQIGGKKRSSIYYDIWNIKYLSKFKWDNLTDELAQKKAAREQKLRLEISAAKKEREFYLSKVEKSRNWKAGQERKKKQNTGSDSDQQDVEVNCQLPRTRPVASDAVESKPQLSKDVLARVFGA